MGVGVTIGAEGIEGGSHGSGSGLLMICGKEGIWMDMEVIPGFFTTGTLGNGAKGVIRTSFARVG